MSHFWASLHCSLGQENKDGSVRTSACFFCFLRAAKVHLSCPRKDRKGTKVSSLKGFGKIKLESICECGSMRSLCGKLTLLCRSVEINLCAAKSLSQKLTCRCWGHLLGCGVRDSVCPVDHTHTQREKTCPLMEGKSVTSVVHYWSGLAKPLTGASPWLVKLWNLNHPPWRYVTACKLWTGPF